ARALHARLRREGGVSASGPVARELQARLLAIGEEVHTDAGHHATRLLTWERWAARDMAAGPSPGPPHAERLLDEAARLLGGEAVVERLPWHAVQSAGRRTQQASPTARGGKPRTAPGA